MKEEEGQRDVERDVELEDPAEIRRRADLERVEKLLNEGAPGFDVNSKVDWTFLFECFLHVVFTHIYICISHIYVYVDMIKMCIHALLFIFNIIIY